MTSIKMLNFYNFYMNKIITFYYVIGAENGRNVHATFNYATFNYATFNHAIDMMELGLSDHSWKMRRVAVVTPVEIEVDIERPLPKLSLIHPDDCSGYNFDF